MKAIALIGLLFSFSSFVPVSFFYSSKEFEIFDVLLKPYGVNLLEVIKTSDVTSRIPLASQTKIWNCTGQFELLESCNSSSVDLVSKTVSEEFRSSLKLLQTTCPTGSFYCFRNQTASDEHLKSWFKAVKGGIKCLCKRNCWKTLDLVSKNCFQKEMSGLEESDMNIMQYVNEALASLCLVDDSGLTCTESFISNLLKKDDKQEAPVCNVANITGEKNCPLVCYQELHDFHNAVGCCIGSVRNVMGCHHIEPKNGSFGILLKDSYFEKCQLVTPETCKQGMKKCTSITQRSPTPSVSSSLSGNQIAGVCLAVVICIGAAAILGNYFYRRMKRREKLRFEDYGYSRLKMMENDFYYDVEDDDTGGLIEF